jgi:hypothetical protein
MSAPAVTDDELFSFFGATAGASSHKVDLDRRKLDYLHFLDWYDLEKGGVVSRDLVYRYVDFCEYVAVNCSDSKGTLFKGVWTPAASIFRLGVPALKELGKCYILVRSKRLPSANYVMMNRDRTETDVDQVKLKEYIKEKNYQFNVPGIYDWRDLDKLYSLNVLSKIEENHRTSTVYIRADPALKTGGAKKQRNKSRRRRRLSRSSTNSTGRRRTCSVKNRSRRSCSKRRRHNRR